MRTQALLVEAIRTYQKTAASDTRNYFELQSDDSFTNHRYDDYIKQQDHLILSC